MPQGTEILVFTGVVASDLLLQAKLIRARWNASVARLKSACPIGAASWWTTWSRCRAVIFPGSVLQQVLTGRLFRIHAPTARALSLPLSRKPGKLPV
jgi:hypothetical protein